MIRHLRHKDIDKARWDAAMDACPFGKVYALSWWLDIVSPGWEALVEGDYSLIMPLPVKRKFGFSYLVQPYFCQQLGVFKAGALTQQEVTSFLDAASGRFRRIRINLNHENAALVPEVGMQRSTQYLSLDMIYEHIFHNYSESHKKNLRRASRHDLVVNSECSLAQFMTILGKDKPEIWKGESPKIAEALMRTAGAKGMGRIYGVFKGSELICGSFFALYRKRIYFVFSATTPQAVESKAMFLLKDTLIRNQASTGSVFDFMGSMLKGVSEFNEGFGARKQNYLFYSKGLF